MRRDAAVKAFRQRRDARMKARCDEEGRWITMNGTPVYVEPGQTAEEAGKAFAAKKETDRGGSSASGKSGAIRTSSEFTNHVYYNGVNKKTVAYLGNKYPSYTFEATKPDSSGDHGLRIKDSSGKEVATLYASGGKRWEARTAYGSKSSGGRDYANLASATQAIVKGDIDGAQWYTRQR